MSKLSTRRAAEQAIIDAAYRYRTHVIELRTPAEIDDMKHRLFIALQEHEALGLEMPNLPALSNNTTDTSGQAGASLKNISGDARACYEEIVLAGGLTVDQVEVVLNRPHQTVSARVNQLRDSGWVCDSGMRRKTRPGRNAIVWRPTEMALRQT